MSNLDIKFKRLTPFKRCVLQNFPFIEEDFDALTNYGLLCKVVAYLNKVIASQNEVQGVTEEIITAFNNLYDYVNNFFDNLDVQEEINNKLDEMVEDGTFEAILANYLVICGGNPKAFGAKGDGVTDDTVALQDAIDGLTENGISKLVIPKGEYVITDTINVPSNFEIEGLEGSVLKYVGDGTGTNTTGLKLISVSGEDADNPVQNVYIHGITIDCTEQEYKGGYSMSTPKVTHTDPAYWGITAMWIHFAKNIRIENCNFNDIYGDGIIAHRTTDVILSQNRMDNVGAGNITNNGQTGYDNHGDGICSYFSYNVKMLNNTLVNKRVYQAGNPNAVGKICGRSGLEFEYASNNGAPQNNPDDPDYNAPDYMDIPHNDVVSGTYYRDGFALEMQGNYVYGYTKGIHLESKVKCNIVDNTVVYNHIGLIASTYNACVFARNYFNAFNIGAAPQSGYDLYYGGIAISEYGSNNKRYGSIIDGNIFEGEGSGVCVASNFVQISNNIFNSQIGIKAMQYNMEGLSIVSNTFNNTLVDSHTAFLSIQRVKSASIKDNKFYSETFSENTLSGDNIEFVGNILKNTRINNNYSAQNMQVADNIFTGNTFTKHVLQLARGDNSIIQNNIFNIEDMNTSGMELIYFSTGSKGVKLLNNKFNATTTLTNFIAVKFEAIEDCEIVGNKYLGTNDIKFIVYYNCADSVVKDNTVANCQTRCIHCSGSCSGHNVFTNNIGDNYFAGTKPNDSLSSFVNHFFQESQEMIKYNLADNATKKGWICTQQGYYVTDTWTTGTSYTSGKLLKNSSGKVYKCVTAGSGGSTVEPTHTTFADVTETDGYVWKYMGLVATFLELNI